MYRLVPTDPKTGKLIRAPKTYQRVRYALQGPRGGIKRIKDAPIQTYFKKDERGLDKTLSGKNQYVVYEQLSRRIMRDEDGKKVTKKDKDGNTIYRRQPSGRRVPVYLKEKAFTYYQKDKRLRPVLYDGAKRKREMGIGFQTLSPRQQADQKAATFVKPDTGKKIRYELKGKSVREAMANLILDVDKRKIYGPDGKKTAGLFYNIVTRIEMPDGTVKRIPASGSLATLEKFRDVFPDLRTAQDAPGQPPAFVKEVRTLANVNREIAFAISNSMARVGYRMTKLNDLRKYAGQMKQNAARLQKQALALHKAGKDEQAGKKFKSVKRILDARETMLKDKTGRKYLSPRDYKVNISLEFETVPE